jgi:hypothetical protein
MSRPTRNASIIASQRITKILKPLRNSFENLTVDEPSINEVPAVVPAVVPVEVPVVVSAVVPAVVPVEVPAVVPAVVPVEVPAAVPSDHPLPNETSLEEPHSFVWKPLTSSYQHTPEYIGMIRYIRLKLAQAKNADMVTNQTAIQDIFQALIINPTCLMYHVELRNVITCKMDEIEETIASQWKSLQTQKVDDTLWSLKSELYRTIQHPAIQDKINQHMSEIIHLYNDYSLFLKRNELLQNIYNLRTIMKEIQILPGHLPSM